MEKCSVAAIDSTGWGHLAAAQHFGCCSRGTQQQGWGLSARARLAAGELLGGDEQAGLVAAAGRARHALEQRNRIRHVAAERRRRVHVEVLLLTRAPTTNPIFSSD